jgi:hypothetical protein
MEVAPMMISGPTCTPWTKNPVFRGHFGRQISTSTKDWPTRMTPRAEIVTELAGIHSPFKDYQTLLMNIVERLNMQAAPRQTKMQAYESGVEFAIDSGDVERRREISDAPYVITLWAIRFPSRRVYPPVNPMPIRQGDVSHNNPEHRVAKRGEKH